MCINVSGLDAVWMCCCRAREQRWSPWSQIWASARLQWSSSPSTVSRSKSKSFFSLTCQFYPTSDATALLTCVCVFVLLSLSREYDNLKISLKSSNDMCEKLKREVLTSNNKVIYMDVLLYPEELVLPCVLYSRLFSFSCTKHHWKLQRPERTWSLCRLIWKMQRKRSL